MKVKTILLLVLALFMTAGACYAEESADGTPTAVAPDPVYEFKPVLEGEEVVNDFVIQNKGTAPLRIERVKTG